MYKTGIFNTQQLLFAKTRPIIEAEEQFVDNDYYKNGWTIIDNVENALDAIEVQEGFLRSIDTNKISLHARLASRIKLAKADEIPVCDDIVATSYQVLHFDMGQPFFESDQQLLVTHVGIYLPKSTNHKITAKTRIVGLDGLLKGLKLSPKEIEKRLITYVKKYGDGWGRHNTCRLACFARFIDAMSDNQTLTKEIDKTVGQWFNTAEKLNAKRAYKQEKNFYEKHKINLSSKEKQIALKPGQLLILDNSRVIHGRIGVRKAKEIYNFMFGVREATNEDIKALRKYICKIVAGNV